MASWLGRRAAQVGVGWWALPEGPCLSHYSIGVSKMCVLCLSGGILSRPRYTLSKCLEMDCSQWSLKNTFANSRDTQMLAQETIKAFLSRNISPDSHLGSLRDSPWCNTSYTVNNRTNKGQMHREKTLGNMVQVESTILIVLPLKCHLVFSFSVCLWEILTQDLCEVSLVAVCSLIAFFELQRTI